MSVDIARARQHLKEFDFQNLFIEQLGWDRHNQHLDIAVDGKQFKLNAVAHKRGMVAFECISIDDKSLPLYPLRRKIDQQVTKSVREHIIIYTDPGKTTQVWQWVKREPGRPTACREHPYHKNQPGDALIQKLQSIAFSLAEEESLTIVEVAGRARAGFDVERITKKFYERFKTEHDALLKFIKGIPDDEYQRWYASVMLNRLMFIYFIQEKGFLDNNQDYLRKKLAESKERGKDKYYSGFLCPLFFEGFAKKETERSAAINKLLGNIPYLNGGLFLKHQIEELHGKTIQIPDSAFEKVFDFFKQYQWHLDERPVRKDDEINPDVLGYIFEKYINQKQMGAYYTKEDITEYISKNTVIPFLFDAAKQKCKIAFEGDNSLWRLLSIDPDRYIYNAVKHGMAINIHENPPKPLDKHLPLPKEIAAGLEDVSKRMEWNRSAPAEYALPTEIWREVVARRKRYEEVREKLAKGEIRDINDFITYNLDIRQLAQDVIETSEGPELLRAFYHAIEKVTVLDPTCGSGAFLFAALNILEPLYEACLDRMQVFLDELDRSGEKHRPEKYSDFKKILAQIEKHPNRKYFIFKSIIVNNLYGVDIMEEAVEICKLRLFLKLVAQVGDGSKIEPLPDIDFNIRAGNTLVGFATYDEIKKSMEGDWISQQALPAIEEKAQDADRLFQLFHQQQTDLGGEIEPESKQKLTHRLKIIEDELNRYLSSECGVDPKTKVKYERWLDSHKPFHWFIEFHRIIKTGGFDVIIGNPPYSEVPKELNRSLLRSNFKSSLEKWSRDEDLYTLIVERSLTLLRDKTGQFGMILPLSVSFSTKRPFVVLRQVMGGEKGLWLWSHFDRIPSSLFGNEVRTRCTIALLSRSLQSKHFDAGTTSLLRWNTEYRDYLFNTLNYSMIDINITAGIPKVYSQIQADVLKGLLQANAPLNYDLTRSISFNQLAEAAPDFPQPCVYIGGTAYNWFPAWRDIPTTTDLKGKPSLPARTAGYGFSNEESANIVFALLCSSMGYWWWAVASDAFNLKKWLLERFPVSISMIPVGERKRLAQLGGILRRELKRKYVYKDNKGRIGNFFLPACVDEVIAIDTFLGEMLPILSKAFFDDIGNFNALFSRAELDANEEEDG